MAASSPALSNNSSEIASIASVAGVPANGGIGNSVSSINESKNNNSSEIAPMASVAGVPANGGIGNSISSINASKNLRGLNKPKCIKCGNVARSRCPYQSCKSCCAKAQNPCHIHVLKGNSSFPEKVPSSGSPIFDQQSLEVSSSGNSNRVASLRQLSNSFAQFNNLQSPLRSRKPLTRKDAALVNEWRFSKLKEFKERSVEVENEAFDRYIQNVRLLEEVFTVNSTHEEPMDQESQISNSTPDSEKNKEISISKMKLMLRSDQVRTENFIERMQNIADRGLRKLKKIDANDIFDLSEEGEVKRSQKEKPAWVERAAALNSLNDRLSKARTVEDLESCWEIKAQLFSTSRKRNEKDSGGLEISNQDKAEDNVSQKKESDSYPSKWFSTSMIDEETLNHIDNQFFSFEDIEHL